jgi:hypothetical protein
MHGAQYRQAIRADRIATAIRQPGVSENKFSRAQGPLDRSMSLAKSA